MRKVEVNAFYKNVRVVLTLVCATYLSACAQADERFDAESTVASPYRFPLPPRFEEVSSRAGLDVSQLHLTDHQDTAGKAARDKRCTDVVESFRAGENSVDTPEIVYDLRGVCEVDRMAGGVATYDLVGDDLPDVLITRLGAHPVLYENVSRAQGRVFFNDVSLKSGFTAIAFDTDGVAVGDIDNDGDADIFFMTLHAPAALLMVNNGDGTFTEEARERGVDIRTSTTHFGGSATFGDYDGDGWLDLHTSEWVPPHTGPTLLPGHTRLFRNKGAGGFSGVFEDVTATAGVSMARPNFPIAAMASVFHDFDSDGHVDLLVVGDFGTTRWFWSNGDGTFTAEESTGRFRDQNGMGVTLGDVNSDGAVDVYITSIHARPQCPLHSSLPGLVGEASRAATVGYTGSRLFTYDGSRKFRDLSARSGIREVYWGWGTSFGDFRNAGVEDLIAVGGMYREEDECYLEESPRFWVNDGFGNFLEAASAAGIEDSITAKAVAVFDADGDGLLDIIVTRDYNTPLLFRNVSEAAGNALRIRVLSHRGVAVPGARISVHVRSTDNPVVRWSGPVGSYRSVSEPVVHVGVGSAERVSRVTVEFPGGETIVSTGVEVGSELVVRSRKVEP